jgi:uncharacterized protein with HEPN domain
VKDDQFYLLHIRDAAARIARYTQGGRAQFEATTLIQDAVIRNLEIIGEAVKRLSPSLKDDHPAIPWKRIGGMRDVLIHHYFGVQLDTVWEVVETHLRTLVSEIDTMLAEVTTPDDKHGNATVE